ncbi:MAG: MlaD family protein [Planctomycetota bacterium]|jgi:phospholipid/cholesterol/gamma-HCH transport system substrate-binding protein
MKYRRQTVLGAFLLLSLPILTGLTWRLVGMTLRDRQEWTVYFGRDSIIEKGYEVYTSGVKVGRVSEVRHVADEDIAAGRHIRATVLVDAELTLWRDAALVIEARGLLGAFRAELHRGTPGTEKLTPATPLPGRVDGGLTDQISSLVRSNRENVDAAVVALREFAVKLNEGEGTFARLLNDDSVLRRLEEAVVGMEQTARDLAGIVSENRDDFRAIVSNIRDTSEKLSQGKGTLGRLLNEDNALVELQQAAAEFRKAAQRIDALVGDNREDIRTVIQSVRQVADKLNQGEGLIARLLNDPALGNDLLTVTSNLRSFSDDVKVISEDIRSGKGTLGQLIRDEGVYRELQLMLASFRESSDVARENAPLASLTGFTALFWNVLN